MFAPWLPSVWSKWHLIVCGKVQNQSCILLCVFVVNESRKETQQGLHLVVASRFKSFTHIERHDERISRAHCPCMCVINWKSACMKPGLMMMGTKFETRRLNLKIINPFIPEPFPLTDPINCEALYFASKKEFLFSLSNGPFICPPLKVHSLTLTLHNRSHVSVLITAHRANLTHLMCVMLWWCIRQPNGQPNTHTHTININLWACVQTFFFLIEPWIVPLLL